MPVTLEKVKRDMHQFPYELQMYCYHHLNGRIEEGDTYLATYRDMQDSIGKELTKHEPKVEVLDGEETKEDI
jgi:hypothetical protein